MVLREPSCDSCQVGSSLCRRDIISEPAKHAEGTDVAALRLDASQECEGYCQVKKEKLKTDGECGQYCLFFSVLALESGPT